MKTGPFFILISAGALLVFLIVGCPNPENSTTNSPPTASFWDFEVTGAGTAEVNGGYNLNGTWGFGTPQRKYTKTDGAYSLFSFWENTYFERYWGIDASPQDGVVPSSLAYYNDSTNQQPAPPSSSWSVGTGAAGAPTVSRWAIMGNTGTTGNLLTAQYHFSDPDGDAEGTSLYQWYRFNNETETDTSLGTALGTLKDYTTVPADATKYLRFQVTPVDAQGNVGDPVLSGPSFQIGGGS